MLDRERRGAIPTPLFDRTMLLFSEVLEEDQLPELQLKLGAFASNKISKTSVSVLGGRGRRISEFLK